MSLQVQSQKEKAVFVVTLRGRLILEHGPVLHTEVKHAVADGARRVLIDLAGVDYIDSYGLGQMVACLTTLRREQGQLRFAGLSQKLMRAVEMSTVPDILEFAPDKATALGKLTGS